MNTTLRRWLAVLFLLLPVTLQAQTSVIVRGKVSAANATTSVLTNAGVFTGGWEMSRDYTTLTVTVFSDKASATGGLVVQWSADATNVDVTDTYSVSANVGASWTTVTKGTYYRIVYTNGGTTQTAFRLSCILRQSGAPGYTDDGLTDAQLRATPVPVSGTVTANVGTGTQPVSGTFWQSTQPISGTVTANVGTGTQPVSGTFWQATQPVSGTFWQTTQPVSIASMPTTPVTGTFWQATQPVSGTVSNTPPANQSVNQTQVNGVAVSVGRGSPDTGTQRVEQAQKRTYAASTTLKTATAAGTGVFFNICGSASQTVRIQQFIVSGTVATAAVWGDVVLKKTSAATTSGTATTLTAVPLDSTSAAATAVAKYYTVLGTAGTLVGAVAAQTQLFPVTAISATLQPTPPPIEFKWRDQDSESPVLRGTAQCLEANFGTTTTNAPTLSVSVKWTEE